MTDIRQRIIEKATASDGFPEASVTAALKGAREMAILIRERIEESRQRWVVYQRQRPRSFNSETPDQVAIERENKLMDLFIRDLDDLLASIVSAETPPESSVAEQLGLCRPTMRRVHQRCRLGTVGCFNPHEIKQEEFGTFMRVAEPSPPETP